LFQPFYYKHFFPALLEFHVMRLFVPLPDLTNMSDVTKISFTTVQRNPFEILSHLLLAKDIDLTCYNYPAFDLQPFELQSLTKLKLSCRSSLWSMAELTAVFSSFPNLEELSLTVGRLADDFNETVIIPTLPNLTQ
jgi:hypothetical protein